MASYCTQQAVDVPTQTDVDSAENSMYMAANKRMLHAVTNHRVAHLGTVQTLPTSAPSSELALDQTGHCVVGG